VCDFSVAVNRVYTTNNERREETTWFKVTCWRQLAETVAQYLTTGRQVMVVGDVKASAYLDKSGQPAATLELTAREVKFLGQREGGGGGDNGGGGGGRRYEEDDFAPPGRVDDIPF
jgi:single-strand DNA-binding protein